MEGHKRATLNPMLVGSISTQGYEIFNTHLTLEIRQSAALSSAIQHAMPRDFGDACGTKGLYTRFPCCYMPNPAVKIKKNYV